MVSYGRVTISYIKNDPNRGGGYNAYWNNPYILEPVIFPTNYLVVVVTSRAAHNPYNLRSAAVSPTSDMGHNNYRHIDYKILVVIVTCLGGHDAYIFLGNNPHSYFWSGSQRLPSYRLLII